nr:unnamed protein product [Digitaria exilis]
MYNHSVVERLTVEEFVHHPFLSEHAPERTISQTPSDIRDGFAINNSSPTRPSSQSSQEDCMPFPLDDETSGQDENPVLDTSAARESPSQDMPMKGLSADVPRLLANSQLADDAYMQIERQFLTEVEYAEELASTVGQIADGTEMPDAIEIIFQSALHIGKRGGVDEMFGRAAHAMTGYTRAVSMLQFLLIEAPSLAVNPPLTLTRSDRQRLRSYIEAINTRLGQIQSQRH